MISYIIFNLFKISELMNSIKIFQSLAEKNHLDTHSIIDSLMLEWVLENLHDEDLVDPVNEVFRN